VQDFRGLHPGVPQQRNWEEGEDIDYEYVRNFVNFYEDNK
jgi:hypothetical protein